MIPDYPAFAPIDLRMKKEFSRRTEKFPLLVSDHSFTNLIGWNGSRHYQVSTLHGNIIVKGDYDGEEVFIPPIGGFRLQATLAEMLRHTGKLMHMPARYVRYLKHHPVEATLDRDNCDYLFLRKHICDLHGRRMKNRRNLFHRFVRDNQFLFQPLTPGRVRYVEQFQKRWFKENKDRINDPHLSQEHDAVLEVLKHFPRLDVFGNVIVIDDQIHGFIIGEALNKQTLLLHFEKCDLGYTGMFPALFVMFCKAHPYRYLNMEQDLGIRNLRLAKLLFRPDYLLKKYRISLLEDQA